MLNRFRLLLEKAASKIKSHVERRDVIIFAIPVVFFTITLLAMWPGFYTSDSYDQYHQAQTGIANTAHPVFHTFTIWLLNGLHHSQAMLPLFQILLFSVLWTVVCKYIRRLYGDKRKIFYIQTAFIVTLCVLPVIYTYTIGAWKDVLYSYSLLSLAFILFVGSNKKFNYSILEIVCSAILLALTIAYRHNGIVAALVVLAVLLIGMTMYKVSVRRMLLLAGLSVGFFILTVFAPRLFLEVRTSEKDPKAGVSIFYMAGFMNSGVKIDDQDQKTLYKIMPEQYWFSDYYRYSYVPIDFGGHVDRKAANKFADELFDMLIKYSLRHPEITALHFSEVNNMAWNVYWPIEGPYKTTPAINAMPLSGATLIEGAKKSKLAFINNEVRLNINYTLSSAITQTLFYRPALYMYLSIAIVVALVFNTRNKRYWLLLLPMLLNLSTILVFGLTQDLRYLYINVLTFFLVSLIALVHMYSLKPKRAKSARQVKRQ